MADEWWEAVERPFERFREEHVDPIGDDVEHVASEVEAELERTRERVERELERTRERVEKEAKRAAEKVQQIKVAADRVEQDIENAVQSVGDVRRSAKELLEQTEDKVEASKKALREIEATLEDIKAQVTVESAAKLLAGQLESLDAHELNDFLEHGLGDHLEMINLVLPIEGALERIDPTGTQRCVRRRFVERLDALVESENQQASAEELVRGCVLQNLGQAQIAGTAWAPDEAARIREQVEVRRAAQKELVRSRSDDDAATLERYEEAATVIQQSLAEELRVTGVVAVDVETKIDELVNVHGQVEALAAELDILHKQLVDLRDGVYSP